MTHQLGGSIEREVMTYKLTTTLLCSEVILWTQAHTRTQHYTSAK